MVERSNPRNFEKEYRESARYFLVRLVVVGVVVVVSVTTLFYIL
jgi:hypothetical protein